MPNFLDGILLGEAEIVLDNFIDFFFKFMNFDRNKILFKLAQNISGFYVPKFYTPLYDLDGTLISFQLETSYPD